MTVFNNRKKFNNLVNVFGQFQNEKKIGKNPS